MDGEIAEGRGRNSLCLAPGVMAGKNQSSAEPRTTQPSPAGDAGTDTGFRLQSHLTRKNLPPGTREGVILMYTHCFSFVSVICSISVISFH